jgi:hypothetical protein
VKLNMIMGISLMSNHTAGRVSAHVQRTERRESGGWCPTMVNKETGQDNVIEMTLYRHVCTSETSPKLPTTLVQTQTMKNYLKFIHFHCPFVVISCNFGNGNQHFGRKCLVLQGSAQKIIILTTVKTNIMKYLPVEDLNP